MTARHPRIVLLHYTSPSVLGGVEQVIGAHARELVALGARVTVVAGRGRAVTRGAAFVRIPDVDSRSAAVQRDFDRLARGVVAPEHGRLVARLVAALRPIARRADRVVVHNVLTMHKNLALAEALAALARERPGRIVAWTHDLAWRDPQYATQLHRGAPWELIARAQPGIRYVAVSEDRARETARLFGLPRSRVAVVPNGVDVRAVLGLSDAGGRLADRLGLLDADPLLLLPARITRRKRIEIAIEAVAALRARGHDRAALVVTGPPGAHNRANATYLDELRRRARRVRGAHVLYALGVRPTARVMADLYALADALVLPSESEGFGIPLLEAGVRRLPIVCSDLATLRAIARDAATYVAPDADGASLARAVRRALRSPVARLSARAKRHAWSRIVRDDVLPVILSS